MIDRLSAPGFNKLSATEWTDARVEPSLADTHNNQSDILETLNVGFSLV